MKKILSVFMVCLLSFMLVGCGCDKNKDKDKEKGGANQIKETIDSLYTDDNKLVYDNGGLFKLVFFHENGEITGLQHYYEYKDEKTADEKYKEDKESLKNDVSIKSIDKSGKYVIYTYVAKEYEGKTLEEVQNTYNYLKPVYKK